MTSLLSQLRDEEGPLSVLMGRGCASAAGEPKRRYATRSDARRASRVLSKMTGTKLSEYVCPDCGLFHLTKG